MRAMAYHPNERPKAQPKAQRAPAAVVQVDENR